MDREIAELVKLTPEEVYGPEMFAINGEPLHDFGFRGVSEEPEFHLTPDCLSDCYDTGRHSVLCQHSPEPF
jgi:hypothetical protein